MSDILNVVSSGDPIIVNDDAILHQVCQGVLEKLDDKISDVQNQAVKCLEAIVQKESEPLVKQIVENLQTRLSAAGGPNVGLHSKSSNPADEEVGSSVIVMAIGTVVNGVAATKKLGQLFIKTLLPNMFAEADGQSLETMEILADLIHRFGPTMNEKDTEKIQALLLKIVSQGQGLIRKRAASCLGLLSRYTCDSAWNELCNFLEDNLTSGISLIASDLTPEMSDGTVLNLTTYIQLCGILAKSEPSRLKSQGPGIIPLIIESLDMKRIGDYDPADELSVQLRESSLNALECLVSLDSQVIESYVTELADITAQLILFNPNTVQPEENPSVLDEDMDLSDGEGDFDDFGAEDDEFGGEDAFSDEEDQSWRIRRSAAKLGAALCKVGCPLHLVYAKLLHPLTHALTIESEDTVELELLNTLYNLIQQTGPELFEAGKSPAMLSSSTSSSSKGRLLNHEEPAISKKRRRNSDVSMSANSDPHFLLSDSAPKLFSLAKKRLTQKNASLPIIQSYISKCLLPLLVVLDGITEDELNQLCQVMLQLAKSKQSSLGDVLDFLKTVRLHESAESIANNVSPIVEILAIGLDQPYYKVCSSSLDVVCSYLDLGLPAFATLNDRIQHISSDGSFTLETREKAIRALGLMSVRLALDASTLLTLVKNSATRLAAFDAIACICSNEAGNSSKALGDPHAWCETILNEAAESCLRGNKPLKITALNATHLLLSRLPELSVEVLQNCWEDLVAALLSVEKLHGLPDPQILEMTSIVLSDVVRSLHLTDSRISDFAVSMADHSSVTSFSTEASLTLMSAVVSCATSEERLRLYDVLSSSHQRESQKMGAMALATLLTHGEMIEKVSYLEAAVQRGRLTDNIDWILLVLGSLGELTKCNLNLDSMYALVMSDDMDESTRTLAGEAIGKITSSNIPLYTPELLERSQTANAGSSPIIQYAYLRAIKELIASKEGHPSSELDRVMPVIWSTLTSLDLTASMNNNMTATIAECMGRLSLVDPHKFLPELQGLLKSPNASTRAIAVSSIKFTFSQPQTDYDALLEPIIVDFLSLMDDEELAVRQVALNALAGAIHNKSYLISAHLERLLPLLYRETAVNKGLVHQVQMGPFKHTIDDGLDLRKSAYDTIHTLLNAFSPSRLRDFGMLDELVDRVLDGLDDDHDIKVLSCIIIDRLVAADELTVIIRGRLESLIGKFSKVLDIKLKPSAVKQDIEKQNEIVRNIIKTSGQINEALNSAQKNCHNLALSDVELSSWTQFYGGVSAREQV